MSDLYTQLRRLRGISLVNNSYYLLAGTIISTIFGFLFWSVAAHTMTAADIGLVTAAISSSSLLISWCDFGLQQSLIYFAANREEQASTLVNAAVSAGWVLSALAAIIFVLGMPYWSPGLLPIRNDLLLAVTFIAFTILTYLLTLQDGIMLLRKKVEFVFWRSLGCNLPPFFLLLPFFYLVGDYRSLFMVFALPNIVVGLVAGLVVLPRYFSEYRFFGRFDRSALSGIASYSLATHVGNLLWSSTTFALPLIAINTLSATATGYFYISWTLANFVLIIPRTVCFLLFVEVVKEPAKMRQAWYQSLLFIVALTLPLVGGLWFWGDWVLQLFGKEYINMNLLRVLLLSVVPFSINSIFFANLRVYARLFQLILFSAVVAASIIVLSHLLALRIGVEGLAWGWLLGHAIPALGATTLLASQLLVKRFKRNLA